MRPSSHTKSYLLCLALFCSAFLVQCGGSDDPEPACVPSLLTGGDYAFTLGAVRDGCAGGVLAGLIQDEYPVPPPEMTLPAFDQLPATININLPFVGLVQADLSVSGNTIQLNVPSEISFPGVGDATVSGVLCPVSATEVQASLTFRITQVEPAFSVLVRPPCNVVISLTGNLL